MEKKEKNSENSSKNGKILQKLQKINPYRKLNINPKDGFIRDSQTFVYYQKFIQWFVDIILNGFFLCIILFVFNFQPLHWVCILGDGIFVWFFFQAFEKLVRVIKQ